MPDKNQARPKLSRSGVTRLITVLGVSVLMPALFFTAAGSPGIPQGWLYFGGILGFSVVGMLLLLLLFPEVVETVNARGRMHRDVKSWDKVFGLVYSALLLVEPIVAGLDVGRLGLSPQVSLLMICLPATLVTLLAHALIYWAMAVNRHAETGVRIQGERDHAVISSGPYRWVRHPFYTALILTQLAYPLALGSVLASFVAMPIIALFLWRTSREDATLQRELPGYVSFTRVTRYRLLPGVW